jgi:hypothetical protein
MLLSIIVIIAALVGVATPFTHPDFSHLQKAKTRQDLDIIRSAINRHNNKNEPLTGSSLEPLVADTFRKYPWIPGEMNIVLMAVLV